MKRTISPLFLLFCLPLMAQSATPDTTPPHDAVLAQAITLRDITAALVGALPLYNWSPSFREFYQDSSTQELWQAPVAQIIQIIDECLTALQSQPFDQIQELSVALQDYKNELLVSDDEYAETRKKVEKICNLSVHCLSVTGHLFLNGIEITSNGSGPQGPQGIPGPQGPQGPAGPAAIAAVTSTNNSACSYSVARFDTTSTTTINNAPLQALDLNTTVAPISTAPLLANDCATTNINLALVPKGLGALMVNIPDDTTTGGNARGMSAVDLQLFRGSATQVASGYHSTIGGGAFNTASGYTSTVGGGFENTAHGNFSVVSGQLNTVLGGNGVIAGGTLNTASGEASAIGGGQSNTVMGYYATVPGGYSNTADGDYSFAAGQSAIATHTGAFVWADSTMATFTSAANDSFNVRASGGIQMYTAGDLSSGVQVAAGGTTWASVSDRNKKENFKEVDTIEILNSLVAIPLLSWNYKTQDSSIRHIGPMAQDFNPAFGFTEIPLSISTLDFDGVALAAIQGLYKLHSEKTALYDERIAALEEQIQELLKK